MRFNNSNRSLSVVFRETENSRGQSVIHLKKFLVFSFWYFTICEIPKTKDQIKK